MGKAIHLVFGYHLFKLGVVISDNLITAIYRHEGSDRKQPDGWFWEKLYNLYPGERTRKA